MSGRSNHDRFRWWPIGLRSQAVLLLLCSILLLHFGSVWIYDAGLRGAVELTRDGVLGDRLAAAGLSVMELPYDERDHAVHRLATPGLRLHWTETPALTGSDVLLDARTERLRQRLTSAIPNLPELRLATEPTPDAQNGHFLLGSLMLPDRTWLNFMAHFLDPVEAATKLRSPIASASVMAIGVTAVALVLVSLLMRPLARIANAAERIGRHAKPVLLEERGPKEIRLVAAAFNAMQARLLQMSTDQSMALAAVSHDLRTPLQRLRLRCSDMDADLQARTEADLAEMEAMIASTLGFLRGELDSPNEAERLFDIASMLGSICDDAAEGGRAVSFEGPAPLPMIGHPTALKRAFINLIENAVMYGGVARVKLRMAGQGIVVEIEDDGPGIPEHHLPRVFDPFWRGEASRNRDLGGVGLGLTIARRAVEAEDGALALVNRRGGGLTVRVELPPHPLLRKGEVRTAS